MHHKKIVEIWTVGDKDVDSYVILEPINKDVSWVVNGEYLVHPDKENNTMHIPFTHNTHHSHYLGDIEFVDNYNETINRYRDNKKILGINLIKVQPKKSSTTKIEEPPF